MYAERIFRYFFYEKNTDRFNHKPYISETTTEYNNNSMKQLCIKKLIY